MGKKILELLESWVANDPVTRYWLLLRGGIVQSVPCNCNYFLIDYASNHSRIIQQSTLFRLQQRHVVAKRGETGREMVAEFCVLVSLSYLMWSLICSKNLRHGATSLRLLRRKSCYSFLSPLKIHRSRPGLNPRTLGPMTSTITIIPPRTTVSKLLSGHA
jgi:hypothetical protein